MTNEEFLAAYESLVDAPNGVRTLRGIVIDLAISGKLTTQVSSDAPVTFLETDPTDTSQTDNLVSVTGAFRQRPRGWMLATLGQLCAFQLKNTLEPQADAWFLPMEAVPDRWSASPGGEVRKWEAISKGYSHFSVGDVVLAKITPCFQNGKACVIEANAFPMQGAGTTELHVLRCRPEINPYWVLAILKSPAFHAAAVPNMSGTAGQQRVPRAFVESWAVLVPSRAEQNRIVERVNELMALCDRLEVEQERAEELRLATARSTFAAIVESATTDRSQSLRLLNEHLEAVLQPGANTRAVVGELRKAITDLAVTGGLIESSADEWAVVALRDVVEHVSAGWSPACDSEPPAHGEWGVLKISSISSGAFIAGEAKRLRAGFDPRPDLGVRAGDVLVARASGSADLVGASALVDRDYPELMISDKHLRLTFSERLMPEYFQMWNSSSVGRRQLRQVATGSTTTMKNISQRSLLNLTLALPPVEEQALLIAQVDKLKALLAEYEAALLAERRLGEAIGDSLVATLRT